MVLEVWTWTDNDFLYYLIKNSVGQIVKNVHGAVFDTITRQTFNNIVVSLPPLPTQRSIAAVLSSFDDKIELLRKENETLEKIAQTVFNEWFVKFNFPNEEGRPYRDSGGKMVELELGEVPEGWKVDEIGSYVKVVGGSTPSTKVKEFWNGDIYWTTPKDLSANKENTYIFSSEKKITEQGLVEIGSRLLPENTLLLSSRAPIGYLAITGMKTAINQGHIAFMPGAYFSSEYMYLWLRGNMDKVEAVAHGAVFPEISKSSFKRVQAVIPTQDVLSSWQLGVGVLFQKIKNNSNQIKTLSKLRDTLLPKLMSGEVGVA